jgi:methyl acetate hydrolase
MTPSMKARRATIHDRAADGKLTPQPDLALPDPPELDCGGHGLYATVGEYMKFIRMLLNDGVGPNGRVLKAEMVAQMSQDGLRAMDLAVGGWPTSIPSLTNGGEFFPGLPKGWAYTFMVNREETPTGRPKDSLMWAGLANSYYWIDRKTGIGGYWATQILPFHDVASYPGFVDFEAAVYRSIRR